MIPVNRPLFISGEKKYLAECINSGWISSDGPFVKEFEEKFSRYVGMKYGVAVSSGTAALEVAVGCLSLKLGDQVIMPTFTIISCALAVVAYGGVPVFIDSEPETWNIDVNKIEEKITQKTKAIMAVHTYGHPCDIGAILKIAKKHKLIVIEDAAEAQGAEYLPPTNFELEKGEQELNLDINSKLVGGKGKNPSSRAGLTTGQKCGSFGDISCFSFYANKIVTCGEGGMVLTDNKRYFERAKFLRNLGFNEKRRFYHTELARNYRMTNLQAAIGVAQLKNIEKLIKIKRENAKIYTNLLKSIKGLQLPAEKKWAKNVYWMYGVVLNRALKINAEQFARKLEKSGIKTRPFFYPLHLQPVFKNLRNKKDKFPVAERIAKYGLYLPSGLGLKKNEIDIIYTAIKRILI